MTKLTPEREAWVMQALERVADREVPEDRLPEYVTGFNRGYSAGYRQGYKDAHDV